MIINRDCELPAEWTNTAINELIDHAHDLASNGNPAGFFVASDLSDVAWPIPRTDEDYAACRAWIEANLDLVRTAWRYDVRYDR